MKPATAEAARLLAVRGADGLTVVYNQYNTPGLAVRLAEKLDRSGGEAGCWPFTGSRDGSGYGTILGPDGRIWKAHRVAYALAHGAIPAGLVVCHTCDNPPCCNPAHLWAGTQLDNTRDRVSKGRRCASHGEANGRAKLAAGDIVAIRTRHAAGETVSALSREYGVTRASISRIVRGIRWATVS